MSVLSPVPPPPCQEALGMESGYITDEQLSASSESDFEGYGVINARLNGEGAWRANHNLSQWYHVDFQKTLLVTGVTMQKQSDADEWVEKYTVTYSVDGLEWFNVTGAEEQDGTAEV